MMTTEVNCMLNIIRSSSTEQNFMEIKSHKQGVQLYRVLGGITTFSCYHVVSVTLLLVIDDRTGVPRPLFIRFKASKVFLTNMWTEGDQQCSIWAAGAMWPEWWHVAGGCLCNLLIILRINSEFLGPSSPTAAQTRGKLFHQFNSRISLNLKMWKLIQVDE